jgi:hypothetical protein
MRRTGLDTGRDDLRPDFLPFLQPPVDPVKTESAFFHNALGPQRKRPGFPGLAVRRLVLAVISLCFLRLVIEAPRPVWTGHHAVFAPDAPPEILDDDPIVPFEGGFCRADRDAGRVIALHAGHGNDLRPDMGVFPLCHGNHLVPKDFPPRPLLFGRSVGNIILLFAGDNASLASDAFIKIDHHTPFWHLLLLKSEARISGEASRRDQFETITNDQILNIPNKKV